MSDMTDRRSFLGKGLLGAAGIGAVCGLEEKRLMAALGEGGGQAEKAKADVGPDSLPCGKIGKVSISRLFMGGNLIGGWAHSRDLMYVSKLFKSYNTKAKIFETLALGEQCGINTILMDPRDWDPVLEYNRDRGGKIQTMVCVLPLLEDKAEMRTKIRQLADKGATLLYTQGVYTDQRMHLGEMDVVGQAIDLIKEQGVPAGVGSHSLETPIACEKNNLNPDFYVKTLHMDRYWSATPESGRQEWCWNEPMRVEHDKYHDNMWCLDAEKTAAFMAKVAKPWVAFKVMAAGAIHPKMAFSHAYRNGADFIVAGMFDFHVEEDVKIAIEEVHKFRNRQRPWHG